MVFLQTGMMFKTNRSHFFKPLFFILVICLFSCNLNTENIEKFGWKYGGGFYIGDAFSVGKYIYVKNDTLYRKQEPIAKIISLKRRIDLSKVLIIQSLASNEMGTYYAK